MTLSRSSRCRFARDLIAARFVLFGEEFIGLAELSISGSHSSLLNPSSRLSQVM